MPHQDTRTHSPDFPRPHRIKIISASGIDKPVVFSPAAPSGSKLLTAEALKNDPKLQQQQQQPKTAASASRLSASQLKPRPAAAVAGKDKGPEGAGREEEGLNFFQRLQPGVAAAAQVGPPFRRLAAGPPGDIPSTAHAQ